MSNRILRPSGRQLRNEFQRASFRKSSRIGGADDSLSGVGNQYARVLLREQTLVVGGHTRILKFRKIA